MASLLDQVEPEKIIDTSVFDLLGLSDAPQEKKETMMQDMMDTVENRVLNRILDPLNDEEITEFTNLIGEDAEKVRNFLAGHKLDIVQITAEEVTLLKLELMSMMQDASLLPPVVAAA